MKPGKLNFYAILISLFASIHVRAQYVTIPDANFVNWLNTHGFASCMSGNQLDTTCSSVVNEDSIDIHMQAIYDITGISYFDNLQYLSCYANYNISFLPPLPLGLNTLICGYNQISSLPPLPNSLLRLDIYSNHIGSLPSTLPPNLQQLIAGYNPLYSLPALPASIRILDCSNDSLSTLPSLPVSLRQFWCDHNQLTSLPAIPDTVNLMICSYNQLTALPALPDSLTYLHCNYNQLTDLPPLPSLLRTLNFSYNNVVTLSFNSQFPPLLRDLYCDHNLLTSLPILSDSLAFLSCTYNQLQSLPSLPDTMTALYINNNVNLTCLPPIYYLSLDLDWDTTAIQCLPNAIAGPFFSVPSVTGVPLCNYFNTNNCQIGYNISGMIYIDGNNNCLYDNGETVCNNIKVILYQNSIPVMTTFTDALGRYSFLTDTGTYTWAVDTAGMNYTVSCPLSFSYTAYIPNNTTYFTGNDFSLSCPPGFDVGVASVHQSGAAIAPGMHPSILAFAGDMSSFYNLQCATGVSGTVTVIIQGPASYYSTLPGSLTPTVSGDTLVFSISDFGLGNFYLDCGFKITVDSTANLGDSVCFDISVLPLAGDIIPANNHYMHCFSVVNSYDPNFKEVNPLNATPYSEVELTYTIHFQNTGTAPAQNIFITDTLDPSIDVASLQLLAYDHYPQVWVDGNIVTFNYPNINLPDSNSNEPASHGYVQYRVHRYPNLSPGTLIQNSANIYFDLNPSVTTNATQNIILSPVGISPTENHPVLFKIYPNPAGMKFNIESSNLNMESVHMFDVFGKKVFEQNLCKQKIEVDMSSYPDGIYFIVIRDEKNNLVKRKIIKI
jgi:uncharacterized repeat protein (TIGR01451 family)